MPHSRPVYALAVVFMLAVACSSSTTQPNNNSMPVDSVAVSPATNTLDVGNSVTLTATTFDSLGATLTGRAVSWTTGNASVATVSSSGQVQAVAAGNTTITATSEGKTGSAAVTVNTPAPAPTTCANPGPGWIWCDDFETDRSASYFEVSNPGGSFARTTGVGRNGSFGMRARWNTAQVDAGYLHVTFGKLPSASFKPVDAGTALYRDIYWRLWVRRQPGWTGGGGDKLSRAFSFAATSWAQAMIGHVWSGQGADVNYLLLDPVRGTDATGNLVTTSYNDFANFTWLGAVKSATQIFSNANAGTWYCVEAHVKLNDAGQSNGVFELWINGALEGQKLNMNWLGNFSTYAINAVYVENYWNAGSPQAQERYIDEFVVSTQRINC